MRDQGEEWLYVLRGEIEVHSEFYEPERLREGDSMYLDARMGHAYISKSPTPAEVIAVRAGWDGEIPVTAGARPKTARRR